MTARREGFRGRRPAALLLAVGVTALMLVPSLVSAAPIVGSLRASETSVAQGLPFRFEFVLRNNDTDGATVETPLVLTPTGAGGGVTFARVARSLPGESRIVIRQRVVPSQWFASLGTYAITAPGVTGARLRVDVTRSREVVPRFEDVTQAIGLARTHQASRIDGYAYAAGAAWADVEADGDLDLFVPQQGEPANLWINESGNFVERAVERGVSNGDSGAPVFSVGLGAVFADYDNDGDPDLYISNDGPNRLYRNDGSGYFTDVTETAGASGGDAPSSSASWGDYDNDGFLDLYIANYARCENRSCGLYFADVLLHNEGDGTFSDASNVIHRQTTTRGAGFQAAWFDHDGDGDQDLYLANDYVGPSPEPNVMWRNDGLGPDGAWRFTDISVASGMRLSMNTMGVGLGDYDRDLDIDVALSNIEALKLMRNDEEDGFVDKAAFARIKRPAVQDAEKAITWALEFHDLNLDGWEDLYVTGGLLQTTTSFAAAQPDAVFVNSGGGRFLDLSAPSGADDPRIGRGAAFADFDRDGRVDVYVVNQGELPALYRNVTPLGRRHWLEIDTVGTTSNRDGCGARVIVTLSRTEKLMRYVHCGSTGFASGSDPTLHFGLGTAAIAPRVSIAWPSGVRQTLLGVPADRTIVVTEPGS